MTAPTAELVFSAKAAARWMKRCEHLDFNAEIKSAWRDEDAEKDLSQLGISVFKIYTTRSGVYLLVKKSIVTAIMYKRYSRTKNAKSLTQKN
jgi:hypothetical protein